MQHFQKVYSVLETESLTSLIDINRTQEKEFRVVVIDKVRLPYTIQTSSLAFTSVIRWGTICHQ